MSFVLNRPAFHSSGRRTETCAVEHDMHDCTFSSYGVTSALPATPGRHYLHVQSGSSCESPQKSKRWGRFVWEIILAPTNQTSDLHVDFHVVCLPVRVPLHGGVFTRQQREMCQYLGFSATSFGFCDICCLKRNNLLTTQPGCVSRL